MTKLNASTEYAAFQPHPHQQPMSENHVEKLADSMRENGFWPSKPVSVIQSGSRFTIIDGHHRVAAARSLKIPFFYVVEPKSRLDQIGNINSTVRVWQSLSFAKMEAAKGNPHYVELLRYVESGIPVAQAASLLVGESAHSNNASDTIRTGTFTVKSRTNADTVVSFISEFGANSAPVKSRIFIEALSILLFVPEFDADTLRHKMRLHPAFLQKCNNRVQMLDQLEELYNLRSREKLPLAFLAKEKMKKRQQIWNRDRKAA